MSDSDVMKSDRTLAIHGGPKVRSEPMPPRAALGAAEWDAVRALFSQAWATGVDFGYQGEAERAYTDAFVRYLGGDGYADGVCSGTAALFVGLAALGLPEGSHVLVSCVTDPGTLNAIVLNRLVPVLVDSRPGSYNMGPDQLEDRITAKSRAVLVVHSTGQPAPIEAIADLAHSRGLVLVEDCSQAHGAHVGARKVGTFGHLAMFSTMFTKAHTTGGTGGILYTRDRDLYRRARAHADRGKAFWLESSSDRDPSTNLFPALNLNLDEISCAIGLSSLGRLDATVRARLAFLESLRGRILARSRYCRPTHVGVGDSPYFHVIDVDIRGLSVEKTAFATAIREEGIPINPHYPQLASQWPYLKPYLSDGFDCPNARDHQATSFNLLFNEHYGEQEAEDISSAIAKVEQVYSR